MWIEEKPKTICTQSLFNHGFPADLQFCFEVSPKQLNGIQTPRLTC